ncbi:MAG TPA: activator of alkane oxidation [Caulobacteraceae bacterium]|jgi:hypothetical protein|nr:activator of alkane oxidation [Caulobacteraceae bacterium]
MKTLITLGAAALAAFSITTQASAYSLHPRSTSFTGSGKTQLTKGSLTVPCTAKFTGHTDSVGVGHVTGAAFSGSSLCTGIKATGLPWTAKAVSATHAVIHNVSVSASIFGTCGPSNVRTAVSSTGLITFSNVTLTPDCVVKGSIQTTPHVTIVSP